MGPFTCLLPLTLKWLCDTLLQQEMLNAKHDSTFAHHAHLSLFACRRDWFGSGMYTGYRRTEFCQDYNRT